MKRIAIVEDETIIRENYKELLENHGYQVQGFANRSTAMQAFEIRLPDLAIIDIGLEDEPDGGFMLCQSLRAMSPTLPIIFLTARDSDFDVVSGLRLGADDYLTKNTSFPHLMARIAALFRRSDLATQTKNEIIEVNQLQLDLDKMTVQWQGKALEMTVTEFWMLHALVKRPGHVRSRQDLMSDAKIYVDDSTITSHVKRIRKKFMAIDADFDHINTVYGMGYRWNQ
ncbi:proteobacterial dedicated sortase system response regulator [Parashewanella curva]|uniref:Proteobacterial dedicated sortase system response regulator n=1 Tax=Parashewanella curva TaxID=2338552 RepID=A0A3L8PYW5_9GAMM|nr:proteobacterial dedicated sortase system response regulator [Parashewanella curva]RLV60666.1 proteobacterial dedicated sortase system response regulator [Parashewanella curva]